MGGAPCAHPPPVPCGRIMKPLPLGAPSSDPPAVAGPRFCPPRGVVASFWAIFGDPPPVSLGRVFFPAPGVFGFLQLTPPLRWLGGGFARPAGLWLLFGLFLVTPPVSRGRACQCAPLAAAYPPPCGAPYTIRPLGGGFIFPFFLTPPRSPMMQRLHGAPVVGDLSL